MVLKSRTNCNEIQGQGQLKALNERPLYIEIDAKETYNLHKQPFLGIL
jgi:hypothetical protein